MATAIMKNIKLNVGDVLKSPKTVENNGDIHVEVQKSNRYLKLLSLYNSNFPTDKRTFIYRIPTVGLVLSLLSWQFIICFWYDFFNASQFYSWAFILSAVAVSWELHWGLKIGDKKQYTPWIIFKISELCVAIGISIFLMTKNGYYYGRMNYLGIGIVGLLFSFINAGLIFYIVQKWLYQERSEPSTYEEQTQVPENIYNDI